LILITTDFNGFLIDAIILLGALLVLNKASGWAIENVVKVADISGFGKTPVGFLLISLSTSLPELSVAFFSVGDPEAVGISIGNMLGSNIVNVCLILGVCILYATRKHKRYIEFLPLLSGDEMKDLLFCLFRRRSYEVQVGLVFTVRGVCSTSIRFPAGALSKGRRVIA